MKFEFEHCGKTFQGDWDHGISIARVLDFDPHQPNPFGVMPPTRGVLQADGFVGSTRQGGGCNVDTIRFIPHCHGTHTETIGHIVNQAVPIHGKAARTHIVALLATVEAQTAADCNESYRPAFEPGDTVITAEALQAVVENDIALCHPESLVLRVVYCGDSVPFPTVEAMEWINRTGIRHLVVELPSIDRLQDQGLLTNHHLFWNVPEGTHDLTEKTRDDRTVTEMVRVPESVKDGLYLLDLQVAPFSSDAAPSRPVLFPIESKSD